MTLPVSSLRYHIENTGTGIYYPVTNIAYGWGNIMTTHHADLMSTQGLDTFLREEGV